MNIDRLAEEIKEWADTAFPNRTDQSMYLKMYSEMGEMIEAFTPEEVADEVADVLIMLLDFGKRKGINIEEAVFRKLEINRLRQWGVTHSGTYHHTNEDDK